MDHRSAAVAEFLRNAQKTDSRDLLVIPGWSENEWAVLFERTQPVELDAGDVLIQPRDGDRALYFVSDGRLAVAWLDPAASGSGPVVSVAAGSVVGELAFFDGAPRSAKVWAATPARLLRFTLEDYERYLSRNAGAAVDLLFAIGRLLSHRVRRTIWRFSGTLAAGEGYE